jgi:predicted CXXCH cytochrome family protein
MQITNNLRAAAQSTAKRFQLVLVLFLMATSGFQTVNAQDNDMCMMCHSDTELTGTRNGKTISVYTNQNILQRSAHAKTKCVSCHKDLMNADVPHESNLKRVNCGSCHTEHATQVENDIHSKLGIDNQPDCKSCHGTHDVSRISQVQNKSKTFCGQCHTNDVYSGKYHALSSITESCMTCHQGEPDYTKQLSQSIHQNLSCANCHGDIASNIDKHAENPLEHEEASCYTCHGDVAAIHKESIHGVSLTEGINEAAHCWDCHGSHEIISVESENSPVHPKHLAKTCGDCHDDPEFGKKFHMTVKSPAKNYSESVHGKLLENDSINGPSCTDCHGVHSIKNRIQEGSSISTANLPKTCGQCHEQAANEYQESIHWFAARKGVRSSPSCNECHTEHSISAVSNLEDRTEARIKQEETCVQCHQSLLLAERFGMNNEDLVGYQDSYHGMAVMRGDDGAAMCIDCHGVHAILPKEYENSTVHIDNVRETCQQCHPNAGQNFAASYSHTHGEETETSKINSIVEDIYIWLIVVVIGGMILHNLLIFFFEIREKYKKNKTKIRIPRLTPNEIIQHTILLTSFIILAITGFQLKFPDSAWSEALTSMGLTEPVRRITHRVSAVVMIALSIYHVVYLIITSRGRDVLRAIFPRYIDAKQAVQNVAYYLGLRKKEPAFDKFNYIEKAEYWALVWGTLVMGLTGFILWFPTLPGDNAPVWLIKVSETVHYYEAILATLAIIVWHWFFVMFRPKEYPVSLTVLDGKMTVDHFKEEHRDKFRKVMLDWHNLKSDKKKFNELNHYSRLFIKAVEKSGADTDEFLTQEIEKDDELKAMTEQE